MQTRPFTPEDISRSVISVPPMARDHELKFDRVENEKIIRHLEAGGIRTVLYGGNANFYHTAISEYASILDQLSQIAGADTLVIPSAGPAYGTMMDQAEILRSTDFPTVMVLPHQGLTTSQGVAVGLSRFAEKAERPIGLYIKYGNYIDVPEVKALINDGVATWIKYAIVRENPAEDEYLTRLMDAVDPLIVVSGIGEQPVIDHLVGFQANGFTSGCVCIRPDLSMKLLAAVQSGDLEEARQIQAIFKPLEDLRNQINPVRVLHTAVHLAGIADTGPALPLLSGISSEQEAQVQTAVRALQSAKAG